jgi:hypothetical protein
MWAGAPAWAGASHPWAVASLLAVNVLPLLGVTLLGWSLLDLMLLYWFENVVVGTFTALKMLTARGGPRDAGFASTLFLVGFFALHFGMFWSGHGNLLVMMFDRSGADLALPSADGLVGIWASGWAIAGAYLKGPLVLVAVGMFVSHGVSYVTNFVLGGEGDRLGPKEIMFQPYVRVVVLHVTLLVGGFLAVGLGAPVLVLIPFVALKTAVDLWAHGREHRAPA